MAGYSARVIAAIYELHRNGRYPTSAEIAQYLELPHADVKVILRDLHTQRLFRSRQRDRRKVWMPWEAA